MTMKYLLLPLVTLILILALPGTTTAQVTCGATPFTITASSTDESCFGAFDGSVTVQVTGGIGPFTYSWDNGLGTNQTVNGVGAGTYTVTVTDDGQGSTTCNDVTTVSSPPALTLTLQSYVDETCGNADGNFCVVASGGTPTYAYDIGGPSNSTGCFSGLSAGTYNAQVIDANGCFEVLPVVIGNIQGPTTSISSSNDASCFGNCDGSATVQITSGTAPFTYLWDAATGNQTTATAINLCAGTYQVTITDANGCTSIANAVVTEPLVLAPNATSTDVSCNGTCDGTANVAVTGGDAPYTYSWSSGQTTAGISGLCAGSYQVQITDNSGCVKDTTVIVNQPAPINPNATSTDVLCNGTCDGSATIAPLGGTPPYTYLWVPSAQTTATITGLCTGTYQVQITDDNGCVEDTSITINEPAALNGMVTVLDASCSGSCDGQATLSNLVGGTAGYSYEWFALPGSVSIGQTGLTASGLCAGDYYVVVTDNNGCTWTSPAATVNEPAPLTITYVHSDVTCFGQCDGDATVLPSGGTAPYLYLWNGPMGQTAQTATGYCVGTYEASITDANGCTNVPATVTINEPTQLGANVSSTDASCNGSCDGTLSAQGFGGTPPYIYQWLDATAALVSSSSNASGLCAGIYTLEIMDANACLYTTNVTISEPAAITVVSIVTDVSTCGGSDGQIVINATGGTPGYVFSIDNGVTFQGSNTFTGLPAGTYSVVVEDGNVCQGFDSPTVQDPGLDDASFTYAPTTYCTNDVNPLPTITGLTGGTFSSASLIINPTTGEIDLAASPVGTQQVTYTTNGPCPNAETFDVTIVPMDDPSFNFASATFCTGVGCALPTVTGTPGGTFTINNGGTINPSTGCIDLVLTAPGSYDVTYTTGGTCPDVLVVSITLTLPATAGFTLPAGPLCPTGTAIPTMNGGAASGTWTAQPSGLDIDAVTGQIDLANSLPNTYMVYNTIAATPGCPAVVDSFSLEVAQEVTFTTIQTDETCLGVCDATLNFTMLSGAAPFMYSIDNGTTFGGPNLSNLCAGTYDLLVVDANGCVSAPTQIVINSPAPIITSTTVTQPSCSQCDGTLEVVATGGAGLFTYAWNPAAGLSDATIYNPTVCDLLTPVMYYITITDVNGCSALDSVQVTTQCDSVYPGDTNYDNIANNNDLLPIGLAYGTTGPVRPGASLVWTGQVAPNWADTLTGAVNYKHIDTNGDGVIDDNDTTAIVQNYGMAHAASQWKPRGGAGDPDLYFTITSDTLQPNSPFTADLELGTPSTPADMVYGLAYTVWFNEETLDSASGLYMDFSNSWIGTEGVDMITVQHLMWQQGQLDVAQVRIDGNTVSGWGPIGSCHAVTTDNLSGKSNKAIVSETLTLDLSHVTIINELGEDIPVNVYADSVVVMDTATSIGVTPNWHYEVNTFPIPSNDKLTITTGSYKADWIALYNAVGEEVYRKENFNDNRLDIDLASWPNGVYFLEIEVAGQRVNRRIVVSH